jgi:hypothetical protein
MNEIISWLTTAPEGINFKIGSPIEINGPPILIIGIALVFLLSIFWVSRDAHRRGKNPFLAFLFATFITWPFSIFWWLWLRPDIPIAKKRFKP